MKNPHLGFLGSFDMLFLMLQANYGEKISLMQIFSLVNPNAPGLRAACNAVHHSFLSREWLQKWASFTEKVHGGTHFVQFSASAVIFIINQQINLQCLQSTKQRYRVHNCHWLVTNATRQQYEWRNASLMHHVMEDLKWGQVGDPALCDFPGLFITGLLFTASVRVNHIRTLKYHPESPKLCLSPGHFLGGRCPRYLLCFAPLDCHGETTVPGFFLSSWTAFSTDVMQETFKSRVISAVKNVHCQSSAITEWLEFIRKRHGAA